MARGNTYTCVVCGKEHQFCPKCRIAPPNYDYERYCSKTHANIFAILSKHGCGLATAEDTLNALDDYDLINLSESIEKHIDQLFEEVGLKEVESPTQE